MTTEKHKPNILLITTDQQHDRMMSCTGNESLETPAIDSLAHDGIRFEKAYCTNPVCVPSRTSMATGMMPGRLGASSNGPGMEIQTLPEEVDRNSLGKVMKRAGYDTFHGGKVHTCRPLDPSGAGYDVCDDDSREGLPAACLDFINTRGDRPFFAVASFINPHDICFAHYAYNGKDQHEVLALYEGASALPADQLPPLPDNFEIQLGEPGAIEAHLSPSAITPAITMRQEYDERQWQIYRWIYCRLTEQVDRLVGEILDGLSGCGLVDDTLIVFLSDHGNMDASHRLSSKGLFYQESVGVPMILKHPGSIAPGSVDNVHLVSTGLDLLPTLCDYAGIEAPAHLLGQSIRPLADGREVSWRSYLAAENSWGRMIQSRRHKYCIYGPSDLEESLVDLEEDSGEMRNIVAEPGSEDVLLEHQTLLSDWVKRSSDREGEDYLIAE